MWSGVVAGWYVCVQQLTMLVDEHADGDAAGVETVQEVLNVVVSDSVLLAKGLFVLDDSLSHGGDHLVVSVPDGLQDLHIPGMMGVGRSEGQNQNPEKNEKSFSSNINPLMVRHHHILNSS